MKAARTRKVAAPSSRAAVQLGDITHRKERLQEWMVRAVMTLVPLMLDHLPSAMTLSKNLAALLVNTYAVVASR